MARIERRMMALTEIRSIGSGKTIQGYAATFNSVSQDLGGFRERIRPGAFSATLKSANVVALWNHDRNFVLGRNVAKTLQLAETSTGLRATIFPPSAAWAQDLMESIERGDVSGMSFSFKVRLHGDQWLRGTLDALPLRELLSVDLHDVSVVVEPAYSGTSVSVMRSLNTERSAALVVPELVAEPRRSLDSRRRRLRLLELCA